jgi:hypothetical protein
MTGSTKQLVAPRGQKRLLSSLSLLAMAAKSVIEPDLIVALEAVACVRVPVAPARACQSAAFGGEQNGSPGEKRHETDLGFADHV